MKYTLLELVQDILSSMDSDEVSSINDTVESEQVSKIVRTVYFDLIRRANLPEHYSVVQLSETSSASPIIMTVPTDINELGSIKYYDESITPARWEPVEYVTLNEYFNRMDSMDTSFTDVSSFTYAINSENFTFLYRNDRQPTYYATLSDDTIIFDSVDTGVESFLRSAKTRAQARMQIVWTMTDGFTPDLDEAQFPLLLSEAKSLAWAELKQTQHTKAEQSARRNWTNVQKHKRSTEDLSDFEKLPNYGRRGYRYYRTESLNMNQ